MDHVEAKLRWTDEPFKRRVGTTKEVFQTMLRILQDAYDKDHALGGSPPKSVLATVSSLPCNTIANIERWNTSEPTSIAPNVLSFESSAGSNKPLLPINVSVTGQETRARRNTSNDCRRCHGTSDRASQKNQEAYYSGKKKRHTLKSQIIADAVSGEIYSVEESPGRVHDFE